MVIKEKIRKIIPADNEEGRQFWSIIDRISEFRPTTLFDAFIRAIESFDTRDSNRNEIRKQLCKISTKLRNAFAW